MDRDRLKITSDPPITLKQVRYTEDSESLQAIRREVFLKEQGIRSPS